MKLSRILCSNLLACLLGSQALAQYVPLDINFSEQDTKTPPLGRAYHDGIGDTVDFRSEVYAHKRFESSIRSKAFDLFISSSNQRFLPEMPSGKIGYIDTDDLQHEFVMSQNGAELTEAELNLPNAGSVVIIPLAKDSSGTKMFIHQHKEPGEAYGFDQDFWSTAGGRVDEGTTPLNAMLNEWYEESNFQMSENFNLRGYDYDADKKILFFFVECKQRDFDEFANTELPDHQQFWSMDLKFFPAGEKEKADQKLQVVLGEKGLDIDSTDKNVKKEIKSIKKEIDKKFQKKVRLPRIRGDFDSVAGLWAQIDTKVERGERFLRFDNDGRFNSFKNPLILDAVKQIYPELSTIAMD
ncbi:MAG: NUDIX domain-containing protein [Oligoflexales bacterium]